MRMKGFRLPVAALCVVFLLLSACGAAVPSDGPGLGKWRNSDIVGSMQKDEEIRVQDDFAAAVNQDWAVDAEPGSGSMMSVMLTVMDKKQQILEREYSDHDGQELKKFYDLAADWKSRDQAGVEPLRPYLEAIAQISSPEDLAAYMCDREKNPLGLGILMPGSVTQSGLDPAVYLMKIEGPDCLLGSAEEYFDLDAAGMEQQEYVRKVTGHVLGSLGYTEEEIRSLLADNYRFEKKAAGAEVNLGEDAEKAVSLSFDECARALLEDYPLGRILDAWGVPRDVPFYMNSKTARKLSALFTQENIPQIRAMLTVHLVMETVSWLDRETMDLAGEAKNGRLQEAPESSVPEERREQYLLQSYVSESALEPILDRIYLEQYAGEYDIEGLTEMADALISAFRDLFAKEAWLSEEGQKACIEKLDALAVHIVEPDFDMVSYDGLSIRSGEEGGTFLEAVFAGKACARDHYARLAAEPLDRSRWDPLTVSTTETNAVYMPTRNGIYIFAGILEAPVYSSSMSFEEVLGGIGAVVAHEITHGFDDSGARYNKDGLEETWMSFNDQMAFSDRCLRVSQYYSTIRPIPAGGAYDGNRVKEEATADMGGIRAALAVAADHPGFDYDAFFRQYARIWACANTADTEQTAFETDVHPLNYLRVNVGLQQFEEFHETYGTGKGDGMFLPEDQRIAVW